MWFWALQFCIYTFAPSAVVCSFRTFRRRSGKNTASGSTFTTQSWLRNRPSSTSLSQARMNVWVFSHDGVVCHPVEGSPLLSSDRGKEMDSTSPRPSSPRRTPRPSLNTAYSSHAKMLARLLSWALTSSGSYPVVRMTLMQNSDGEPQAGGSHGLGQWDLESGSLCRAAWTSSKREALVRPLYHSGWLKTPFVRTHATLS
mmetsp:Transcript_68215/g.192314  ORF Transcript_68215/g.192314 Transcript_68215/m.192314 type:complete len:200 (+) Transcript_68215:345-944(+)